MMVTFGKGGLMAVDTSLKPLPVKQFSPAQARHLAQRVGFGIPPDQLTPLAERGRDGAIEHLDYHRIETPEIESFEVSADLMPFLSKEDRKD